MRRRLLRYIRSWSAVAYAGLLCQACATSHGAATPTDGRGEVVRNPYFTTTSGEPVAMPRAALPALHPDDAQEARYLARIRRARARGPCFIADIESAVRGVPVEPDYPEEARSRGIGGTAIVRVSLTSAGAVTGATIARSTGSPMLDAAAVAAATATRYNGACVAHKAVPSRYLFAANFSP